MGPVFHVLASPVAHGPVGAGPAGASLQHVSEVLRSTRGAVAFLGHMGGVVWCGDDALTARPSGAFPTLETTDLLQDREAADRSLVALTKATVVMATGDTVAGASASLHLGKGDLQTGQWVFPVFLPLSVVPLLVLHSC